MKFLVLTILIAIFVCFTNNALAQSEALHYTAPLSSPEWTEPVQDLISIIKQTADKYNYPFAVAFLIVRDESQFNTKSIHKNDGGKGWTSRGLAQINSHYHPEVTPEQAYDPFFAVDFLIKNLKAGKCQEWSTCPLSPELNN